MTHDDPSCGREPLWLPDLSPRDISWTQVKVQSEMTANAYAGTAFDKYYQRIDNCAGWLRFALVPQDSGEVAHKLQSAKLCHVRHCPICEWRRSLMWRARLFRALPRVMADYPGKRFIYLTLTVKNCELERLGETLTWMNESWQRLSERKEFPGLGWFRVTEVTRGEDGSAHPHFHALIMVNSNYFKKHYISQKRWRELWAESLRIDYDPQVDIKVVKPCGSVAEVDEDNSQNAEANQSLQLINNELQKAVRYTLKYSTKPDKFLSNNTDSSKVDKDYQDWLLGITQQLYKKRQCNIGGCFKKYMRQEEPESLVVDEENLDPTETEAKDPRLTYMWRDEMTNYLLVVETYRT